MAELAMDGAPVHTNGKMPARGEAAKPFNLISSKLTEVSLEDFKGTKVILNIFPSIDTSTCAESVRQFNKKAGGLENTKVLCISRDLPFAQTRFCGAEGLKNVITLSDFRQGSFGKDYGLELIDSVFKGLHARAVIVIGADGLILHSELVDDISDEPDYEAALAAL